MTRGLVDEVAIHENGDAFQVYFPKSFLERNDRILPSFTVEPVHAQVLPHQAVLLFPESCQPEFPLTIPDPSRIEHELTSILEETYER